MTRITFIRPIDQPLGNHRLLDELKQCLRTPAYTNFRLAVGFAKVGPLARLVTHIRDWNQSSKKIEAILGIDQLGTSQQALKFAMTEFHRTYVTRVASSRQSTFHPKLYIFSGHDLAVGYYGSHNLTVGGTEVNFEGGVKIEFDLSIASDKQSFDELVDCWTSLLPDNCAATELLTQTVFDRYLRYGLLFDETRPSKRTPFGTVDAATLSSTATGFKVKPPSSLPKEVLATPPASRTITAGARTGANVPASIPVQDIPGITLVMQIVPHHNGEIFLSKNAVNQNPAFFEFPFNGQTIPKKSTNKSYPQRIPDPVVKIAVYDRKGNPVSKLARVSFPLNMVYYEAKAEIRITVNPEYAREIPTHSILVMSRPEQLDNIDYTMDIYYPGSEMFESYLSICNQTMPSGGAATPRRMGWI